MAVYVCVSYSAIDMLLFQKQYNKNEREYILTAQQKSIHHESKNWGLFSPSGAMILLKAMHSSIDYL